MFVTFYVKTIQKTQLSDVKTNATYYIYINKF